MARPKSLDRKLDELSGKFIPRIRRAFQAAIADIKSQLTLTAIIDAIQMGDLEAAFRATGMTQAAMRPITAMIETAYEQGGVTTAGSFPRNAARRSVDRAVFRFDVRNSRSEQWLREHSSSLVTRVSDDTRTTIREIIETGVRDGRNPRVIALDIAGRVDPSTGRRSGGIIGLTPDQAKYVVNARKELETLDPNYFTRKQRDMRFDNIVRKSFATETPLKAEKIAVLTGKYSDNLLLLRAETIARTEALQSLNRAQDDAFRQAIQNGTIQSNALAKTWDSAGDTRVRFSHMAMEGQTVAMNEPFKTPTGSLMMFPGDSSLGAGPEEIINCRCRIKYKVDWLADLEDEPASPKPKPIKKVPPVAPPIETPERRNARLMDEQNDYVLNLGRSTGVEHLSAVDQVTGEILGRNTGTKGNVQFTPEFQAAIQDPTRRIVATHNHPSGSSFSDQDLRVIATAPGLRGLYAIGHNGSKYYAELGEKKLTETYINSHSRSVFSQLSLDMAKIVDFEERKSFALDMNKIGNHIAMLILHGEKRLNYTAELAGEAAAAFERQRDYVNRIVKGYLKK